MKQRNFSSICQDIMTTSLIILLISAGFSVVMLLIALVAQVKCYGTLCLVGLAVTCGSFITFTVALVLYSRLRKKEANICRWVD